jgi:hypothetical protein
MTTYQLPKRNILVSAIIDQLGLKVLETRLSLRLHILVVVLVKHLWIKQIKVGLKIPQKVKVLISYE